MPSVWVEKGRGIVLQYPVCSVLSGPIVPIIGVLFYVAAQRSAVQRSIPNGEKYGGGKGGRYYSPLIADFRDWEFSTVSPNSDGQNSEIRTEVSPPQILRQIEKAKVPRKSRA